MLCFYTMYVSDFVYLKGTLDACDLQRIWRIIWWARSWLQTTCCSGTTSNDEMSMNYITYMLRWSARVLHLKYLYKLLTLRNITSALKLCLCMHLTSQVHAWVQPTCSNGWRARATVQHLSQAWPHYKTKSTAPSVYFTFFSIIV